MADLPDSRESTERAQESNELRSKGKYNQVKVFGGELAATGFTDSEELERSEAIHLDDEEEA